MSSPKPNDEERRNDPDRPAAPDALTAGLLAQLDLLWAAEIGDVGMAVEFDPTGVS